MVLTHSGPVISEVVHYHWLALSQYHKGLTHDLSSHAQKLAKLSCKQVKGGTG